MWSSVLKFIVDHRVGDVASIAGLLITFIGFVVTIIKVSRTRKAAERAERAVLKVRQDMSHFETAADFSAAISTLDEIKRLNRDGKWVWLPDRYSALRRLMASIRNATADLSDADKRILQGAVTNFRDMENQIEETLAGKSGSPDVPRINKTISEQADRLNEILVAIKDRIGR